METPDHFRICLTASEPMIERSLPVFAKVAQEMRSRQQSAA
jgi:aspartate aminotransferase